MKKRALSIVLALALCFTMFAGSGFAAGKVENWLNKGQSVLDNATPGQQEVINSVIRTDADAEPWITLATAAVEEGGLLAGIFAAEEDMLANGNEGEMQVLPYFLMRLLQDGMEDGSYDLSEMPVMSQAMEEFMVLNDEINTAPNGVPLGFKESVNMFGDYGDRLTDICSVVVTDEAQAELKAILGVEDVWAAAKEQAQKEAAEAFVYVQNLIFSTTTEENEETTFVENYNRLMASDRTKKNAAIYVGQKLLDQVSGSLMSKLRKVVSFDKAISYVNDHKANLFAADKNIAMPELFAVVRDFVYDVESNSDADIQELIGLLEERGLTPSNVVNSVEIAANTLDSDNGFQAVWFDIILGRMLKVNDLSGDGVVTPGEAIDLVLYNFRMENYMPGYKGYSVDNQMNITADHEVVDIEDFGASGHAVGDYDRTLINEENKYVEVTVYRGQDDVEPEDEVYRYIGIAKFTLAPATIDIKLDADKYSRGDTVKVSADVDGYDGVVTVTVYDRNGKVVDTKEFEDVDGTTIEYEYAIPENALTGDYTVVIGNENKTFESAFTVEAPQIAKKIKIGEPVANDEDTPYVKGTPIAIKGAQLEGFEAITISIIDENKAEVWSYETAMPKQFLNGEIKYTFVKDGWYEIKAGDAEEFDAVRIYVGEPKLDRAIDIAPIEDKRVGEELVVSGTSNGFAAIYVTIVDSKGEQVVGETVIPDADGNYSLKYTIPEGWSGKYIVKAGDAELGAKAVEFNVISGEEKPSLTEEAYDASDIKAYLGTELDDLKLPKTVTLTNAAGDKVTVDIDWSKAEYDKDSTDTQILVGTYEAPEGYVLGGNADGKVEIKVQLSKMPVEQKLTLANEALNGVAYRQGDRIVIKGTAINFDAVTISIVHNETGDVFAYETVTPEQYAAGVEYKLADDQAVGHYKVTVGDAEFTTEIDYPAVFEVIDKDAVSIVEKTYTPTSITGKYTNTEFDSLGLPKTVTLTLSDGSTIEADIDWTDAKKAYNKTSTAKQTLVGKIVLPEGVEYPFEGINGDVTVDVTLRSRGYGGGGGSSVSTKFIDAETAFSGDHVAIKGTTSRSSLVVSLVGPDGKTLKTETITGAEFIAGYEFNLSDLGTLAYGKYTVAVRETANGAVVDSYTFEIKRPVDSNIFNKVDHMNYIVGYEDGTVRPNANISREEVTTVLFRLLTEDARKDWLTEATDKFSDVEADRWSMTSIATLNKAGLLNGYEDGSFRPANAITRAEFAALTARFALKDTGTSVNAYSDIAGHWAEEAINAVSNAGWFQGADGKFRPDDKITRAEAVTVINRILGRDKADKESFTEDIVKFSDLNEDDWFYADMVEATNSHEYEKSNTVETWKAVEKVTDWTSYEK